MRPTVQNAVRKINRATTFLKNTDSTTVEETIALIAAVAALRARIMEVGARASLAQARENTLGRINGGRAEVKP